MDGEDHVDRYRLVHKHKFVVTIITIINIINHQHMQLYSRSVCVCVYYHASCYISGLYNANKVPLGFLWHF